MDSITCASNAKINLFLEIKGKRSDGYHEIRTLFQEISLGDEITLKKSSQEYSVLRCNDTTIPFGKRNLCIKAYDLMREHTKLKDTVEIELEKKIPLGAGLGGGSSNGACVIKSLNKLYELGLGHQEMSDLAAKAGSDISFFIYGGMAVGSGRGEIIHKLPDLKTPIWLTLVKPAISVSTGNAYQWVKGYQGKRDLDESELAAKILADDHEYIINNIYNAFEPIVINKMPELDVFRQDLVNAGCLKVSMSGCGSAFYGICSDKGHAEEVADSFADRDDITLAAACHTV